MNFEALYTSVLAEHRRVFERIDPKQIEAFMDQIIRARRILLIGGGREGLATRGFTMRLMHMGKESHWVWDDTTPNIESGDLFIATCGPSEVGHVVYVAEQAKKAGASLAVVTGTKDGKMASLADTVLWVPSHVYKGNDDGVVPSSQPMGNLFEQVLVILFDIIVIMLMEKLGVSEDAMIVRHRNVE